MKLLTLLVLLTGCEFGFEDKPAPKYRNDFRVQRYEDDSVVCYKPHVEQGFWCFEKTGDQPQE